MAVQPGQVHRAFSRDARDLELRLRLRRQRAARQEVLRVAHRVDDGPRPGLARRTHADPRRHVAGRQKVSRRGGIPVRVRQDQLRDADSAEGLRWLEGHDDRRRHRMAEAGSRRPPVCDQSGSRLLRRRAGHRREDESECDLDADGERHLHERRADRGRRRVVGGADRHAARQADRLAGQTRGRPSSARKRAARRRTRTRASPRLRRNARRSTRTGKIRPAWRSTRSSSAGAVRRPCRS